MIKIPLVKFYKRKYGKELLIDVNDIHYIKKGILQHPVHRYNFYCLVLITDGREEITINDNKHMVQPGMLITSIPGDIWSWQQDTQLNGYVLIWEEEFLLSFFNDQLFLQKFSYLQSDRQSPFLHLERELYNRVCHLLSEMVSEIHDREKIDRHVLRAMLYETLMLLNRAENIGNKSLSINDVSASHYVDSLVKLVNADYATQHGTKYYADKLCITPNYLNKIVRRSLGTTTKSYIRNKILLEAKRLLTYTTLSVTEITDRLHFESTSYFVRWFHKYVGCTPVQYRGQKYK
ncbi:MAG: AraC family transcriptional regulator [Tannerella sp.]|jgi:AraC-like DNA-binding protein|nr:AraC family transcriptional regulator [Tannerella sp.]